MLHLDVSTPQGSELVMSKISKRKHKRYDIEAYYRNESKTNQKLNFDVCIPQGPMIHMFALLYFCFFRNKKMLSLRLSQFQINFILLFTLICGRVK